jgi:peroxiredoxin
MLSLMKRNVLSLVAGGVALVGVAAPSAWAQHNGGKPGTTAAQPEHKEHKDSKKAEHARIGEQAPNFELKDTEGKTVKLSDYQGKIVVIDWVNPACPVCRGHYEHGTIQNLVKKYQGKDVVFLGVNSTASGKDGAGAEANSKARTDWNVNFPFLLDESGKVGRTYGAKTTPHCYVIDKNGVLQYSGAIDNGSPSHIPGKTNYVEKAVDELLKGESVATHETKSYGCAVKYGKGA